jgi:hypothetical protein
MVEVYRDGKKWYWRYYPNWSGVDDAYDCPSNWSGEVGARGGPFKSCNGAADNAHRKTGCYDIRRVSCR